MHSQSPALQTVSEARWSYSIGCQGGEPGHSDFYKQVAWFRDDYFLFIGVLSVGSLPVKEVYVSSSLTLGAK